MFHVFRFAWSFRRTISWWAFSLLLGASAQAQNAAPRHTVLIDGSGSMTGFFNAEEKKIHELHKLLRSICGGKPDSYYFIDRELLAAGEDGPERYGNETYLSDALTNALTQRSAPAILWLITDNQPSAGRQTSSDADIQAFYKRLQNDKVPLPVKRLYLFPLRLPFNGPLYKEDGHTELTGAYVGQRGLLVYALLLDVRAREEFDRATLEFQDRFGQSQAGGVPRLLIKPLEEDTITAELVPGDKFRVEHGSQLVAGDFAEGAPIKGAFKILLTSKLRQMTINSADIDVRVPEKFQTGDFAESKIEPQFSPHTIKDFEPKKVQPIDVTIDAPGVHIRNNPISWWNCILHNRGDISGHIQISIKVPGEKFNVVSTVADEFSTDSDIYNVADERTQSRIYKLNDLVKQMMPTEGSVDIHPRIGDSKDGIIPVRLTVLYPKWPGWLLVAIIILLLLLIVVAWRFFGRRQSYRLTWDNGNFRACPDFRLWPFVGQRVDVDNRTAATIKQGVGGIRVRAASGYTVDDTKARLVNPRGSDFNVSHSADDAGVTFYFSTVTAAFSGGATTRDHDDDILGGVTYGDASDAGGGSVVTSTPPIRKPSSGRSVSSGTSDANSSAEEGNINLDDLFP